MKKSLIVCFLLFSLISIGFSQVLPAGSAAPVADGILNPSEYTQLDTYQNMRLGRAVSTDGKTLYFALEAPASGWVSIGLGSNRMDGAYMILGYDDGKNTVVREETGKGHRHQPNAVNKLLTSAVKETSGKTVLEFSLPSSEYAGITSLKMLLAYGKQDNFTSMHQRFVPVQAELKLQ
jgi:hypothetical protein